VIKLLLLNTTVLTTTVKTIARPTTVATDPYRAYRAWSRIPPGSAPQPRRRL